MISDVENFRERSRQERIARASFEALLPGVISGMEGAQRVLESATNSFNSALTRMVHSVAHSQQERLEFAIALADIPIEDAAALVKEIGVDAASDLADMLRRAGERIRMAAHDAALPEKAGE